MAYSFTDLALAMRTLAAADKPLAVGRNWAREKTARWSSSGTWANGGTGDESDTGADAMFGFDDFSHVQTYPDSSQTDWYWIVDLGSEVGVIDAAAIVNLTGIPATTTIEIDVADDNAFTSNPRTIASIVTSDEGRHIFLDLDHGVGNEQRYSSVRYVRFHFSAAGGFVPKVGEFIVGQRRQFPFKSNRPWDPNHLINDIETAESSTGIRIDFTRYKKRRKITVGWDLEQAADAADFESFWEDDTDGGRLPFLWVDDPGSSPSVANWMKVENPELMGPYNGPTVRHFSFIAIEQAPHFLKLE